MTGPLDGVIVLDLTSMISGPSATMMLADQGAKVIKIENPKGGDHTRQVSTGRNGLSASFLNNNRNKYSVALNLKDPRGVALAHKLAKTADVVVQNFRPGVADRIGVGEPAMRKTNPGIIYVSISGFGDVGPYAQKPVYDPLVQAVSGLASVQGASDQARPKLVRTILPDKLTGYACAQAITAALFSKLKTGEGQHIKMSMLDTVVGFLWGSDMGGHTFVGDELEFETAQSFIDLIYETKDGYISVAVQSNKEWAGLCHAFGRPDLLTDARFSTPSARHQNIDERLNLTQTVLLTKSVTEWMVILEGHDVPCAPVLTRRQMITHPQIVANETLRQVDHPVAGRLRQANPAPRFSKTPIEYYRPAPLLGSDTAEVLSGIGIAGDELAGLIKDGVATLGDAK